VAARCRDLDECCSGPTVNIYSVRSPPGVAAPASPPRGARLLKRQRSWKSGTQYPNAGAPGPAETVFLGVPEVAGGVRHPVDESKTKPTYSASTIAASVIPAHGPPRCRRPRPNQDRPPSAPAAQTRLSAAAHRVPGRLHHLVDHGHGWRAAARPGPAGAGGWLPGGDAIGGQMAEVWGRSLGPLRWLGGEMQLNREACCCGSRSVSPTTGTTSRCATTSRRLSGPRASI
jgi:hypothetical protein